MSRPFGIGLYFLVVATTGVIQNCATTLGEEIGWRGFLVPELAKRFSFTATAVLSGAIWALWHVPIIVFAGYNAGTGWYGLAVVSASMIGLCFVLTWLRLKSGSLWTGVILHASSNHVIQQFFDPMTANTGRTKYILGEFGIGFTFVVAVLAAYFWMRRAEVAQPGRRCGLRSWSPASYVIRNTRHVISSCWRVNPTNASTDTMIRRNPPPPSLPAALLSLPAFSPSPYSIAASFSASTSPSVKISSRSPFSSVAEPLSYAAPPESQGQAACFHPSDRA